MFVQLVESKFAFLTKDFGFEKEVSGDNAVEYRRGAIFIRLSHSKLDEMSMRVGLLSCGFDNGFSGGVLVALENEEKGFALRDRIASHPEQIEEALGQQVDLLRTHGKRVLDGDLKVFAEMRALVVTYWRQRHQAQIRQRAENAFAAKDYVEALKRYKQLGEGLRPLDRKRMEICQRQQ